MSRAIVPLILSTAFLNKRARLIAEDSELPISGVYPHLTTYGMYSEIGGHHKSGRNDCGDGAIVPWASKLWSVNDAPRYALRRSTNLWRRVGLNALAKWNLNGTWRIHTVRSTRHHLLPTANQQHSS